MPRSGEMRQQIAVTKRCSRMRRQDPVDPVQDSVGQVELLVVLAILAVMATVAVTSTDVFLSQGRYEATTRTLTDIQEAVLGPPNARQADGTLISTGFVADVGRSPLCITADSSGGPSELLVQPAGVAAFSLTQSANDTDLVVPCGWRGPYLRLPPGQTSIHDGWGNPLNLFSDTVGDLAVAGNSILSSAAVAPVLAQAVPTMPLSGRKYRTDRDACPRKCLSTRFQWKPHQPVERPLAVQVWMYGPNPSNGGLWEAQWMPTTGSDGVVSYSLPAKVHAPGFLRVPGQSIRRLAAQPYRAVPTQRCRQPEHPVIGLQP